MADDAYLIGIDLGTTNCTLAYAKKAGEQISQFQIPQQCSLQETAELPALPSFLYFPLAEEKPKLGLESEYSVGTFAQVRGFELPGRLVSSAKSWLCQEGINRREKCLPQDAEAPQISPLDACSAYLHHLKLSWDSKMAEAPFQDQRIFITVPASFDPMARELVLEAASLAGYPSVILLEEPQAAFYAWIERQGDEWRKQLKVGDSLLVVDIGGGTTDFSLIQVAEENGDLTLERVAVGAHLLLGGDNIDLALAHFARQKLEQEGHEIDDWQMARLVHGCREAKELFFGEKPPLKRDLVIPGRGSRLVGGSVKITITKQEADSLILDGFFPIVQPHERSTLEKRLGMRQMGLNYAQDPRITAQLAKFLSMTGESAEAPRDRFVIPSAILFNGGTLKAEAFRERLLEAVNTFAETLGKPRARILPDADYDFAVGRGAVCYGVAREGKAVRIRSGTNRSFWIGVEEAMPAVPGLQPRLKAVCVVPFGMEEGTEQVLANQTFSLTLGELASFRFFSRATSTLPDGSSPAIGDVVKKWSQELTEHHPVETRLDKGSEDGKTVCVHLRSKVTELGVLELFCEGQDGRRWKLEFNLR